jgi:hypothetical protein
LATAPYTVAIVSRRSLGLASSTSTITVVPSGASSVEVRRQGRLDHKRERGDGIVGHQSWQQRPLPSGPDALVVGGSSAALNFLGFNSSHNALAFYCFGPSCASCIFLNWFAFLSLPCTPQTQSFEVQHGRLRAKVNATIAVGTVGEVRGFTADDVQVSVVVDLPDGKKKTLVAPFKPKVLEFLKDTLCESVHECVCEVHCVICMLSQCNLVRSFVVVGCRVALLDVLSCDPSVTQLIQCPSSNEVS